MDIFHKRHLLHLSFAGYHFIANVHQAMNKNRGHKNTQKKHFLNMEQKNHPLPSKARWPPLRDPTIASLRHSL